MWSPSASRRSEAAAAPRRRSTEAPSFLLGANLPWVHYGGDFGANHWHPDGGLTSGDGCARVDEALARLKRCGVSAVRWFMLCDGRAGIRFDPDGTPMGLDEQVFADIDAAVGIAAAHGLSILFALIDFTWCGPPETVAGVQIGGRAGVLADPGQRNELLERVFAPILTRYGSEPTIMGWDIINEPEWATFGLGAWNPHLSVPRADMRAFIQSTADVVHRVTKQPATVGLARGESLDFVEGLGLDFYQVHWYDRLERLEALADHLLRPRDPRPVLLGEFPTRGSNRSLHHILAMAQQAGYSGAFYWSALANDDASDGRAAGADLDLRVRSGGSPAAEPRPSLG